MKKTFLLLVLALPVMAFSKTETITSPDGKIKISIPCNGGLVIENR